MEIVKWLMENWMVILGGGAGLLLAIIALLKAFIALAILIPGNQGEAAAQKVADAIQKVVDVILKVTPKK